MAIDRPPVRVEVALECSAVAYSEVETVTIDRAEWDALTPAQRAALCEQIADEEARNRFAWGWHIYEPDDYAATQATPGRVHPPARIDETGAR